MRWSAVPLCAFERLLVATDPPHDSDQGFATNRWVIVDAGVPAKNDLVRRNATDSMHDERRSDPSDDDVAWLEFILERGNPGDVAAAKTRPHAHAPNRDPVQAEVSSTSGIRRWVHEHNGSGELPPSPL